MATVNFSVPDEVKTAFDETFGDENKSAIIADLMRRAVSDRQLRNRRIKIARHFDKARHAGLLISDDEIRKIRRSGRS